MLSPEFCLHARNTSIFGFLHYHISMSAAPKKSLYARRIEQGLCGLCGCERKPDASICSKCLDKQKKRYKKNRASGGCFICGEPTVSPGASYCEKHYDMRMNRRKKRSSEGLCYECGKHEAMADGKRCETCFFHGRAKALNNELTGSDLKDMLANQGNRCLLSGRKLVPGVNAHLDHIIPRSKGGSDDLENLRWVDKNVNYAKRELSDEEFLLLVADVFSHAKKKNAN